MPFSKRVREEDVKVALGHRGKLPEDESHCSLNTSPTSVWSPSGVLDRVRGGWYLALVQPLPAKSLGKLVGFHLWGNRGGEGRREKREQMNGRKG